MSEPPPPQSPEPNTPPTSTTKTESAPETKPEPSNEPLQDLLDRLHITDYDLVLVGDGSGSKWGLPIGWACVAIERGKLTRKVFYGSSNEGTNNTAELLAYLIPLNWYMAQASAERSKTDDWRVRRIHIVTDSQYVRDSLAFKEDTKTAHNIIPLAALKRVRRRGYTITCHWLEREDLTLNHYADVLSKAARQQVVKNNLVQLLANCGQDADKLNPQV